MTPDPAEQTTTPAETTTAAETTEPSDAAGETAVTTRLVKAPRRRAPKLDALLAESVEAAREALHELAEPSQIGEHRGATVDDDRLVTHRFAADLPGYRGWDWFATLARAPRSRIVTVCEIGLLPGDEAIVAPDWVPWSDRVSAEEKARLDAIAAGEDPEKALQRLRSGGEPAETDEDSDEQAADGAPQTPDEAADTGDPASPDESPGEGGDSAGRDASADTAADQSPDED